LSAFRYEAADALGAARKGVINADNARAARADLRAQGLVPISVDAIATQLDEAGKAKRGAFGDRLSTVELALFTRQLASLLEASLPLEQALSALLEQAERTYMRDLTGSIRSEVMGGAALSDALAKHPTVFDNLYIQLVRAGEVGGVLDEILARLADNMEKSKSFRNKTKGAMIYPVIVLLAMVSSTS